MNSSFHEWSGDKRLKGLVIIVLGFTAISLLAYTYSAIQQGKAARIPASISVSGVGEVNVIPDIATFTLSAHAEAIEPTVAQEGAAQTANAITAYLKENGIAEVDINTTNYTLSPQYDYTSGCREGACTPNSPRLIGYVVDQTIQVKVRDTKKAGELIFGVGTHGAKNISSISFTVDDSQKAKADARTKAVADAREKARQLADSLGVRLTRLTSFYEDQGYPYAYQGGMMDDGVMVAKSASVTPEISGGQNTITSTVSLTYEIR